MNRRRRLYDRQALSLSGRGTGFVTAAARLALRVWLAPGIRPGPVDPWVRLVTMNLEMLVQGSPVRVILGALVALEPGLGQGIAVFSVGVVVELFQVLVLQTKKVVVNDLDSMKTFWVFLNDVT